jgi:uncharacterized protein YjiS (DUF1127 family)
MTVQCSWCVSPYRQVAEEQIAAGSAVAEVSRSFGLSQWRHHKGHGTLANPKVVSLAAVRAEVLEGGGGPFTVIPRLEGLIARVQGAEEKWRSKPATVTQLLRLERDLLNDVAKLRGEFPQKRTINVGEIEQWRVVLDALAPYPKALHAISVALSAEAS